MNDAVTVPTKMQFKPFAVPNAVFLEMPPGMKQDGIKALPSFALPDVEPEVLDALAQRWLDNLFASVGRASPFRKESA